MEEERIELGQRERDRLRVLHEVEQGHLKQREAGARLRLSERQIRPSLQQVSSKEIAEYAINSIGRSSNRLYSRCVSSNEWCGGCGSATRISDRHWREKSSSRRAYEVSRGTLRRWMSQAGLRRRRTKRARAVHVWRARRSAFGEMVMMDSSPYAWLEERGPAGHLVAMIDDATSRIWVRLVEHDTTEENMRTLWGWVARHGRPLALYTDKNGMFVTSRPVQREEQLKDQPARTGAPTSTGRARDRMDRGPQSTSEGTDRAILFQLARSVSEIDAPGGNQYSGRSESILEIHFIPEWEQRFAVSPRHSQDAHRPLDREQRLEQILSVRAVRMVTDDHTVSWEAQRWGVPRESVCAGLRRARVEIERRLDESHWLRFRGRYLSLHPCPDAPPSVSLSGLRPPGLTDRTSKTDYYKTKSPYIPPPDHPWRRTFPLGRKPDISTLR